jgi:hypothetical protein
MFIPRIAPDDDPRFGDSRNGDSRNGDSRTGGPQQPFHWHRYPRARALLKRTVDHFPDEDELRELHARSTAPEDPAST